MSLNPGTGWYGTIRLEELDWDDDRFAIPGYREATELDWSLQRFGLLQPPWIWQRKEHKPVIVDGFKRLRGLRETGKEAVMGLVFPATMEESRLWLRRIAAKLYGPPLNVAEKAQIVARLAQLECPQEERAELLRLLQVAPRAEVIEQWKTLACSEKSLLEAAAAEQVCDRAALALAQWQESGRRQALALLRELRCSASIQMQILEQISEIALAAAQPVSWVLQDAELREIRDHADWNHRQKTQAVRDFLRARRFPRLQRREQQFVRDLQNASLPAALRLVPPPAFEGARWQLQIIFSRPEELVPLLEEARTFAASGHLPRLLSGAGTDMEDNS